MNASTQPHKNPKQHSLWLLTALALPLAGCGVGVNSLAPTPYTDAYRVSLTNLGYEQDTSGTITIPAVTANLVATAGAPDVRELDYTAVLLNSAKQPAALNNSPIVPASGTLMVGAKGGYRCLDDTSTTELVESKCIPTRADAIFVNNGAWNVNTVVNRAITPGEWAVAHLAAATGGETAQWYAELTYTAYMTNGSSTTWKQLYQFTNPAK
ncbi:hypothetical protein [Deinococcus sp.]|uniref:hypothetical protein n=1 Tax=Deinococcus sp. TaxID=47478 RepID=UPI003B5CBCFE